LTPQFVLDDVSLIKSNHNQTNTILKNINLTIYTNQITSLIGPSGAGKSSLLRLLNRLDDPSAGAIYYDGQLLKDFDVLELRRKVGMVFQIPVMFDTTVAENIKYASRFGKNKKKTDKSVIELLDMVGLDPGLAERDALQLSVGQQQRVALARTLYTEPEVLLLDELTAPLDPTTAQEILNLIRKLQTQLGLTIVIITHLLQQARDYSDFTVYLENGKLIEFNHTEALFSNPEHEAVLEFIQGRRAR
jgi:putative ABC transport system ATP-binding protein